MESIGGDLSYDDNRHELCIPTTRLYMYIGNVCNFCIQFLNHVYYHFSQTVIIIIPVKKKKRF